MSAGRVALLFDIDGTLVDSGGAGAASWRIAFDELYGIPADIGEFTDAGMTDPEVGRRTFVAVIGHPPPRTEFSRLLERRLHQLYATVADSKGYRILAGVEKLLPQLIDGGYLLGLVTGNVEAAAHIKLHRARLNRFFSFGGYGSDSNDRAQLTKRALERAALVYGEPIEPKQCEPDRVWRGPFQLGLVLLVVSVVPPSGSCLPPPSRGASPEGERSERAAGPEMRGRFCGPLRTSTSSAMVAGGR